MSRTVTTWDDVNHSIGAESGTPRLGWEAQHDLANQLADAVPNLTRKQCGTLVAAAVSGLPVVLTWEHSSIGPTTTTVIVTYLTHWGGPSSDRLRAAYWGFHHDVHLARVTAVELPVQS